MNSWPARPFTTSLARFWFSRNRQPGSSLFSAATTEMAKRKATTPASKRESKRVAPAVPSIPNGGESAKVEEIATANPLTNGHANYDEDFEGQEGEEEIDSAAVLSSINRPPPVNSSYLPLPFKGRLGYV
jgi:hypothetical protein